MQTRRDRWRKRWYYPLTFLLQWDSRLRFSLKSSCEFLHLWAFLSVNTTTQWRLLNASLMDSTRVDAQHIRTFHSLQGDSVCRRKTKHSWGKKHLRLYSRNWCESDAQQEAAEKKASSYEFNNSAVMCSRAAAAAAAAAAEPVSMCSTEI